eukprot:253859-Chlamydomonas_euryale.AAC.2
MFLNGSPVGEEDGPEPSAVKITRIAREVCIKSPRLRLPVLFQNELRAQVPGVGQPRALAHNQPTNQPTNQPSNQPTYQPTSSNLGPVYVTSSNFGPADVTTRTLGPVDAHG